MEASSLIVSLALLGGTASTAGALPPEFWGLQYRGNEDYKALEMDAVKASGAYVLRYQMSWCEIWKRKAINPSQAWAPVEKVFRLAWERGIYILPYFYNNYRNGNCTPHFPSEAEWKEGYWEAFVKEAVQRFGYAGSFWVGKANPRPVGVWEIWNEPNFIENNPGGGGPFPNTYGKFLKFTTQVIWNAEKGGTPQILLGGLFSAANSPNGMSVKKFIEEMHNTTPGIGSYYNSLSLHPYAFKANNGFAPTNEQGVIEVREKVKGHLEEARTVLTAKAPGKGIWITELGWPVAPGGDTSHPGVPESIQADLLTFTFNMIQNQSANLGIYRLFFFNDRDHGSSPWFAFCGLRKADGTFRLAWTRYREQTGVAGISQAPNLRGVLMNGTGSKKTEVHILSGATNYSTFLGQHASWLSETTTSQWQYSAIDYNRDGVGDVFGVLMNGTGSKKTEVHILDGATGYSTSLGSYATALSETTRSQWQFAASDVNEDGKPDLVGVLMNGTGSKKTEVHILDGATNYSSFLGSYATALGETTRPQWQFSPADANEDGKTDVFGILMNGTGSKKTEIHILDGATNYSTVLGPYVTAFSETTPSQWQFWAVDYNADWKVDLFGVLMNGTGSKKTEVHILSGNGPSPYSTGLGSFASALGETTESQWRFAPTIK